MTTMMIMASYLRTAPEVKTVERLSRKLSVPEHQVYLDMVNIINMVNPISPRGADLPPPCANAYTSKNQWVEILIFLYIPKCLLGTIETTFHSQKTFPLVWGSLSWSETPYFHKEGPFRMGPKLPLSAKM